MCKNYPYFYDFGILFGEKDFCLTFVELSVKSIKSEWIEYLNLENFIEKY